MSKESASQSISKKVIGTRDGRKRYYTPINTVGDESVILVFDHFDDMAEGARSVDHSE